MLTTAGFDVVEAADGHSALAAFDGGVDLVVLDRMMPGLSGLDVLAEIRRQGDTPVIMLTGMAGETDRILGLNHGADDYLVKPFSVGELEARVRALLRRTARSASASGGGAGAGAGAGAGGEPITIDRASREVRLHGEAVSLTRKEFDLLAYLAERPRTVVAVDELLAQVWQSSPEWQDPATVKEHVRRLRLKLAASVIRTVRGAGFLYDPAAAPAAAPRPAAQPARPAPQPARPAPQPAEL